MFIQIVYVYMYAYIIYMFVCLYVYMHLYTYNNVLNGYFVSKVKITGSFRPWKKFESKIQKIWMYDINRVVHKLSRTLNNASALSSSRRHMWQFTLSIMKSQYLDNTLAVISNYKSSPRICWNPFLQHNVFQTIKGIPWYRYFSICY